MRDISLSDQRFEDFSEAPASAPKRRAAPSAPRAPKQKPPRGRMFERRRLGVMALMGIGGLALVGVPMNALFFQDGRHPAPLFSTHVLTPEKPQIAETPTPPARPAKIEAQSESSPRPAAKAAAKTDQARIDPLAALLKSDAAPAAKPEKKREASARDQIGALLGDSAAAAPKPAPAAAPAAHAAPAAPLAKPDRGVLLAQRELLRLGYVVKPDGSKSPAFRKTIEKFERDNGLPVTGELGPKVAKAIAARAAAGRPQ